MNDPWKVLGVKQGTSAEEVKKAYRDLVKRFHPDRFQDAEAKELANEKLKEINQAYDQITNGTASAGAGSAYNTGTNYGNYTGTGSAAFQQVRVHITNRQLDAAESMLEQMSDRPAEWYYLRGVCYSMRGWYAMAREHLAKAVNMDPNNAEYRSGLNQFDNSTRTYQQASPFGTPMGRGRGGVGGMSTCDMCSCLLCSDCCCESMGGDCIPCC